MEESSSSLDLSDYRSLPGVRANFLCRTDGSYSIDGSSRKLSNSLDRKLLVHLRGLTDAVVIGGNTCRAEGYAASSRFETYVFTKQPISLANGLHPLRFDDDGGLVSVFNGIKDVHSRILLEAGPYLLTRCLRLNLIDQLCLTINGLTDTPEEVVERLLGQSLGPASRVQTVDEFRFCIWNL